MYLVLGVSAIILRRHYFPEIEPHLAALIEQAISLPIAIVLSIVFLNRVIAKRIPDLPEPIAPRKAAKVEAKSRDAAPKFTSIFMALFVLSIIFAAGIVMLASLFGYNGRGTPIIIAACLIVSLCGAYVLQRSIKAQAKANDQ